MIRPTNNRILVQLTPEDYRAFTTEPNINLFKGTVHSVSEGSYGENPIPIMNEDGSPKFSWVRKPNQAGIKEGDIVMFMRDGLGVPALIRDDSPAGETLGSDQEEGLIHLVLIEEPHIFAVVYSNPTK